MGNSFGRLCGFALLLLASLTSSTQAATSTAAAANAAGSKVTISGVRAGNHGGTTRFVLDLNRSVNVRVFTLANPYRVVIDLPEVDWMAQDAAITRPIGFITGFHHVMVQPGNARIIIDLGGPAGVKSAFVIAPRDGANWRFVLDLQPVSHAVFMAHQGQPPEAVAEPVSITTPVPPPPAAMQPLLVPEPKPAVLMPTPQKVSLPLPSALERHSSNHRTVVAIDPGHGGVDPGAISVSGMYEKTLTLTMARQVKQMLERYGRYEVVLTRDKDVFVPLRERVARARAAKAELFISLHANIVSDSNVHGLSVYTLSEKASDKEAQALADSENKADTIAGLDLSHESPEVSNILIDLAQRETMNLSAGFASDMVEEISRHAKLLRNTHRFAGFAVLKAPDVPSVLIELGYLSNQREERMLRTVEYRAKIAGALARSIDRYFLNVQKAQRP